MYKNFNSSTDYTKNAFEQFTRKKQVNTKFGRDKKSYNKSANEKRKLDRKDVNLKKIKPDTDTSMRKPSSFTPRKIKMYGTMLGIFIICLAVFKFFMWTIQNNIFEAVVISLLLIGFIIFTKFKRSVLKMLKIGRRRRRR